MRNSFVHTDNQITKKLNYKTEHIKDITDIFVEFIGYFSALCLLIISTLFSVNLKRTHQLYHDNVKFNVTFFLNCRCFCKIHQQKVQQAKVEYEIVQYGKIRRINIAI